MKRRSWTHAVRYTRHRLKLDLRSLPGSNDPSFSHRTMDEARQINIAMCRNAVELLGMYADCGNMVETERNLRWQRLHADLKEAVVETARRREVAKLKVMPAYRSADTMLKGLMLIEVRFGGIPASRFAA